MRWWKGIRVAPYLCVFKFSSALLSGVVGLLTGFTGLNAQAPNEDWRSLQTEHFTVTFPVQLQEIGRRAATLAEVAFAGLEEAFLDAPRETINILLTDHADISNGFARVTPSNRITVFVKPPVDGYSLAYLDDWLELVITHELAHVVHLDYAGSPLGRFGRWLLGRPPPGEWPVFPGGSTPGWLIEGLATWYESRLTSAGRVNGTFLEMQLRTAALEGRLESIGQASGKSPLWPGGNRAYAYGSLFFSYLLERYGEDSMTTFVEAIGGQWIPFRLNAAGRSAFGISLSDAWHDWTEQLRERYKNLDSDLANNGPITEPEQLTFGARWGLYPSVSPDGESLVYTSSNGRSDSQLRIQHPFAGPSASLSRTNGLATYSWMPDGRLLMSELEFADPYRLYGDLYFMDRTGDANRLTLRARLSQPSVSPDGDWAVAVQQGGGTNGLVRVDLHTGSVSELIAPRSQVHWAFPRISPDGRWVAASRWESGAFYDVVLFSLDNPSSIQRVTRDRAVDLAPSWSPDGRWVIWSSDRTGVMNIVAAEVDFETGRTTSPILLTNVRTGAIFPSVDPESEWLYFSGHHIDGWEVERIPFEPASANDAPPPASRFMAPSGLPVEQRQMAGPLENYSSLPTLLPTYWEPVYREPVVAPATDSRGLPMRSRELLSFGVGAQTSAFDLVGRHAYRAFTNVFTSGGQWEAGGVYSYRGLGNPILSVRGEQTWGAAGQLLAGPSQDTVFVLERERSASASVTFLSNRWRRNLAVTVTGGLGWDNQELLNGDLKPTAAYTLRQPVARFTDFRASISYATSRTHSFQTGRARGISLFVEGKVRRQLSLTDSLMGVEGFDRSFEELSGRLRAYVPLWEGGHATHVLALQVSGGAARGPKAQFGHFRLGGASGVPEDLTGLELFGGSSIFLPVRGFGQSFRAGRYAWTSSAEYRFPLALVNRGLSAWPIHFDRLVGALFLDIGNAWEPGPFSTAITSAGAEITSQLLGFYDTEVRLRTGVAFPLVGADGASMYLRVGLPF